MPPGRSPSTWTPTSRFGTSAVGSARSKNSRFARRYQPLEAERRLALAEPDDERRREPRVEVGVLHHQRAAGEVRVDVELEPLRQAAAQVRPDAPQRERVDDAGVLIVEREAAVGLQQQADLQAVVAGRRLDDEAVGAGRHGWRGGLLRGRLARRSNGRGERGRCRRFRAGHRGRRLTAEHARRLCVTGRRPEREQRHDNGLPVPARRAGTLLYDRDGEGLHRTGFSRSARRQGAVRARDGQCGLRRTEAPTTD